MKTSSFSKTIILFIILSISLFYGCDNKDISIGFENSTKSPIFVEFSGPGEGPGSIGTIAPDSGFIFRELSVDDDDLPAQYKWTSGEYEGWFTVTKKSGDTICIRIPDGLVNHNRAKLPPLTKTPHSKAYQESITSHSSLSTVKNTYIYDGPNTRFRASSAIKPAVSQRNTTYSGNPYHSGATFASSSSHRSFPFRSSGSNSALRVMTPTGTNSRLISGTYCASPTYYYTPYSSSPLHYYNNGQLIYAGQRYYPCNGNHHYPQSYHRRYGMSHHKPYYKKPHYKKPYHKRPYNKKTYHSGNTSIHKTRKGLNIRIHIP